MPSGVLTIDIDWIPSHTTKVCWIHNQVLAALENNAELETLLLLILH
jgi:hypothetical protein